VGDPSSRPLRLQSWIPPSFAWTTLDVFCIDVPLRDHDVVEFISTGVREIPIYSTRKTAPVLALLIGGESLQGQLELAVWAPAMLKPKATRIKAGTKVVAHCHGVFLLPDGKTLCVVVGRTEPLALDGWISAALKADADALLLEHQSKVAEFNEGIKQKKLANDALRERYQSEPNFGAWGDASVAMEEMYQRPVVTAAPLLELLPRAATFPQSTLGDAEKLARAATAAIAASGWPPSRDGNYAGIVPGAARRRARALVSWVPHTGLPSYPEIRWAVQRRLPAALRKPRIEQMAKPKFNTGTEPADDLVQLQGFDPDSTALEDALEELQFDQSDYRDRVDDVRKDVKGQGFDAIAWFQPYHVWTEETWGIYFDASKLDDLALSFLDDFKAQRVHGSHSLAALLAFGLTYAHELFHARVEAALSWAEINAQQPRHLRYKERVYQALRETPDWFEEALANWSARNWFNTPGIQSLVARMSSNADGLERVVEGSLDLAPPGYQEWRLGHHPGTWRTFANQLSTGNPKIAAPIGLPLESALTGPLPYDFQQSDIPLRFVGPGVIADRLQSHPATLNVISRRELQKALKFYRHVVDVSAGDGSHEKWTGPDKRAFPVPRTDPVSYTVFKSFLHYIGIDKSTYVHQVRPKL
jgi:hypothetical protein